MIKKITITLIILFLLSSLSFSVADTRDEIPAIKKKPNRQYGQRDTVIEPCESPGALGQQECAQKKINIADKKLNATYKELLAKIPEDYGPDRRNPKKALIDAQRLWIKYRDANCQFHGDITGGAPDWVGAFSMLCILEMTEARTNELQKYNKQDYK